MTTLPEKGEGIFGYKIMDRTTVSMLGAQITEFSHIYSGARVLYIENDDRELGFNLDLPHAPVGPVRQQPHFRASDAVFLLPLSQQGYFL